MAADQIIHLCRVLCIGIQEVTAKAIHRMFIAALTLCFQGLCQGHITKCLREGQQKGVLAGLSAGQNLFHGYPFHSTGFPPPGQKDPDGEKCFFLIGFFTFAFGVSKTGHYSAAGSS